MGLEDLRKLRAEAEGQPYLTQEQQAVLEAADEAEYQMKVNEQQLQQYQRPQQGYGGMMDTRPQGIDVYFLNRLIKVELPPKHEQVGLWLTREMVIEQFSLVNMDKVTYDHMMREYIELTDIASGEGNDQILQAKIGEFLIKLISLKSRGDMADRGTRERTAWIRHQISQETTMKMPEQDSKRKGFLSIFGG